MTRPGKAVDNRVALLGAADNSALLPAPSVAEAQGSGSGDRVRAVQEQVESVKGVMQQNVNQMLTGRSISRRRRKSWRATPDPNSNTLTLTSPNPNRNPNPKQADTAKSFHRTAVKARRHFWLQNLKFKAAVCGALLIVLIIILAASGAFNGSAGDDGDGGGGEETGGGDGGSDGGGNDGGRRLLFGA